jgi:predicted protein tyrosine phosphatase
MKRIAKTGTLKRFVIHITAVPGIKADAFDLPMNRNALILCTDRTNRFINGKNIIYKFVMPFLDVETAKTPGDFTAAHAKAIIRFIESLPDSVTDLYICCSKGGSRSAALAAAILKGSGRSDDAVWKNPFYCPNKLVYRIMCNELGLFMPRVAVRYKEHLNKRAFRKAQKSGKSEYERWEIVF